jgi:hypothetical protein
MIKRTMTVLKNGPDVSTAAHNGAPTMTPASESGDETIGFGLQPNANVAPGSRIGSTAAVETITPGSPDALPQPAETTPATDAAPATADTQPAAGASTDPSTTTPAGTTTPATPANTSQESTSKKKSGLRKIIPF